MTKKGQSIIFAVFTLLLLSVVAAAITSIITSDIDTAAGKVQSSRAFWAAEAGAQLGMQAVRDDVTATINKTNTTRDPSFDGYRDIVQLEGYEAFGTGTVDADNACLWLEPMLGLGLGADDAYYYLIDQNNYVSVWNFRQRRNLIGTRISDLKIGMRGFRYDPDLTLPAPSGPSPIIDIQYSVDGGINWLNIVTGHVVDDTSSSTEFGFQFIYDFPENAMIDWDTFMRNDGQDFRIRVIRTNELGVDGWYCTVDCLCLRVAVEIDAKTENWHRDWMAWTGMPPQWSGEALERNITLGNGYIKSVKIEDESGKVHLNYATHDLLEYLMIYDGIQQNKANEYANQIVNHRATDPFDTVEELKQIPGGMDDDDYDKIVRDVTVYSWVNNQVTRPTGARAPVNINTASENVLSAIFRCAINDTGDIDRLVNDIINRRAISDPTPFTLMHSSFDFDWSRGPGGMGAVKCFSGFIEQRRTEAGGYLDAVQRNAIRANADAAEFNIDLFQDWTGTDSNATEFCYYTNTYLITAVGENSGIERTVVSTYGNTYDYTTYKINDEGTLALPTHLGDSTPEPYWREVRN